MWMWCSIVKVSQMRFSEDSPSSWSECICITTLHSSLPLCCRTFFLPFCVLTWPHYATKFAQSFLGLLQKMKQGRFALIVLDAMLCSNITRDCLAINRTLYPGRTILLCCSTLMITFCLARTEQHDNLQAAGSTTKSWDCGPGYPQ